MNTTPQEKKCPDDSLKVPSYSGAYNGAVIAAIGVGIIVWAIWDKWILGVGVAAATFGAGGMLLGICRMACHAIVMAAGKKIHYEDEEGEEK